MMRQYYDMHTNTSTTKKKVSMYYTTVIISALLLVGLLTAQSYAAEPGQQAKVEQTITGAMQLFEAQRKARLAETMLAMAKVVPYLYQGSMGIDSKQVLVHRLIEVNKASRLANSLALMHRGLRESLVQIMEKQGLAKNAAIAKADKLIAKLKPEKLAATYEGWYLVLTALNRVYEYLDNHWGQWKLYIKIVEFGDEKLDIPYQTLMDRLGETIDRMDAIQNAKTDKAVKKQSPANASAPLSCNLSTRTLPDGAVESIVTVKNQSRYALEINTPSVDTVTWILADNQVVSAHPGRPPKQILLNSGEHVSYVDTLDLPPGNESLEVEVDAGKPFGVLKCN